MFFFSIQDLIKNFFWQIDTTVVVSKIVNICLHLSKSVYSLYSSYGQTVHYVFGVSISNTRFGIRSNIRIFTNAKYTNKNVNTIILYKKKNMLEYKPYVVIV